MGQSTAVRVALLAGLMALGACGGDIKPGNAVPGPGQSDAGTVVGHGSSSDGAVTDGDGAGSDGSSNDGASGDGSQDGTGGDGVPFDAGVDASTPVGQPVFVAVGYGGRRIRSTDLGKSWSDDVDLGGGGDDPTLLRTVTFGRGLFVAAGYHIFTSPDGSANSWTERSHPYDQWLGGMEWGNGRFVATGGYGYSAYSLDGMSWQLGGDLMTEASRTLAFGKGMFVTATDPGNWWSSTDGASWTKLASGATTVAFCSGDFHAIDACAEPFTAKGHAQGAGVVLRLVANGIERSEDGGKSFSFVPVSGQPLEDLAFGYVN